MGWSGVAGCHPRSLEISLFWYSAYDFFISLAYVYISHRFGDNSEILVAKSPIFNLAHPHLASVPWRWTHSNFTKVSYITKYNEIRSLYPRHIPIFTDGSKQSNHTATAVVFKSHIITIYQTTSQFTFHIHCWTIINKYIRDKWHKPGTHKHKINSTKFIQLLVYLLTPLFLFHINERTKSYVTDYALDILV